ncbi:iron complex transport system substrate-binding protein [Tamaricihabitans halophyticus]|uniref:Iron complex transport system substrate-binding protein n=1 Tax=Tamaricihabitans halophyticus TaxID=1262583 RepID=A0A4R2R1E8_9PSEU|nr:iron complex transport system substrate-binding protein [Tamaricihabitans halophyticus]
MSLLPAATDLLAELGALDMLVGRTHECDWPPVEVAGVPVLTSDASLPDASSREISAAVGGMHRGSGLYQLAASDLAEAAPDLVLTQDLCDVCAVSYQQVSTTLRALRLDAGPAVLSLEPATLDGVLHTLIRVAEQLDELGGTDTWAGLAAERVDALRVRLATVRAQVAGRSRPRVAAIEWLAPLWPAGHWVPEQIEQAGGTPVLARPGEHTKAMGWAQLRDADPEVILIQPCGFSPQRTFQELDLLTGNPMWSELSAVRTGHVWVVDGPAYFNRPGPRVIRGVEILAHVLHEIPVSPPVTSLEAVPIGVNGEK